METPMLHCVCVGSPFSSYSERNAKWSGNFSTATDGVVLPLRSVLIYFQSCSVSLRGVSEFVHRLCEVFVAKSRLTLLLQTSN